MRKLGTKRLTLELQKRLTKIPAALKRYKLELAPAGRQLIYTYDTQAQRTGITALLNDVSKAGITFKDIDTVQSSLEEIFVTLVRRSR